MSFRLASDGDVLEQRCWPLFIRDEFPAYEYFWLANVVPLTRRPGDVHFLSTPSLPRGKGDHDVCVAQLHYTILVRLACVFEAKRIAVPGLRETTDAFVHLCGAFDLAYEILERTARPAEYDPWLDQKDASGRKGGKEAQFAGCYPGHQRLRSYRNHLIHGRMRACVVSQGSTGLTFLPRIGSESGYTDWRRVTDPNHTPPVNYADFGTAHDIITEAWRDGIAWFESTWRSKLLPTPLPALAALPAAPTLGLGPSAPSGPSAPQIVLTSGTGTLPNAPQWK